MKTTVIFLTLGVVSVIAVPTQTTTNTPLSNDSVVKQDEKTENNGVSEQKKVPSDLDFTTENVKYLEGNVDIVIEETLKPGSQENYPITDFILEQNVNPINDFMPDDNGSIDDVPDSPLTDSNLLRNVLLDKIKDEVMETAEGFVPVPLPFRRRQQARRRFANRRYFRRNPYIRRSPYLRRSPYFYYPYYGFYHPSTRYYY